MKLKNSISNITKELAGIGIDTFSFLGFNVQSVQFGGGHVNRIIDPAVDLRIAQSQALKTSSLSRLNSNFSPLS